MTLDPCWPTVAANLSHRDIGRDVTFTLDGHEVSGCLVYMVATALGVSLSLRHHGEVPYLLSPLQSVAVAQPKEASER